MKPKKRLIKPTRAEKATIEKVGNLTMRDLFIFAHYNGCTLEVNLIPIKKKSNKKDS